MTESNDPVESHRPFFHPESGSVRFWVEIDGTLVGASIGRYVLHYEFGPKALDDDPLLIYQLNAAAINAVVRHRMANGAREPVIVREADLDSSR